MEMFEPKKGKSLLSQQGLPGDLVGAVALGYVDCNPPQATARKKEYVVKVV
jgi:hypothetical protein